MGSNGEPTVSFIIPARNEAAYLPVTLESLHRLETAVAYEQIVVDGASEDGTPGIAREYGARVIEGTGTGQGDGRHLGAKAAAGEWLAFVDADTRLSGAYLDRMLSFATKQGLKGAASRCRISGGWRTVPIELLFNYVLPRLSPPPFPGFNVFVDREAYFEAGGFRTCPNEDMTFSRKFGKRYPTGVCPAVLVETSGRRFERDGLMRALWHYTNLECQRQVHARLDKL